MKNSIWISLNSVFLFIKNLKKIKKKINLNDCKYCFEIFGYDFIIDEELNV